MSLMGTALKGLGWGTIAQIVKIGTQFVVTIILARLLSPEDFGAIAMALVLMDFAAIFGDMGISFALIQKQDAVEEHYSSAFWLNIVLGASLMVLVIAIAPFVAIFYHCDQLKNILYVMSINFLLVSLTIVQQARLMKEMAFKELSVQTIAAVVLSGGVSILLAFQGWGVWSLVAQLVCGALFSAIFLWGFSSWRPKFIFSFAHIKDILPFSINMLGSSSVQYVARNVDKFLVGRFLGAEALGFYSIAYKIMMYPIYHISWTVGKVMFPVYSRMQSDVSRVRFAYQKELKGIALGAVPLMMGCFVIAPVFITTIYGVKWQPVVPLIQIMCFGGMFLAIGGTGSSLYMALGRPDINFKNNIVSMVLSILAVFIGLRFGLTAVALSGTIFTILWAHVLLFIAARLMKIGFVQLYVFIPPAYLLALLTAGGMWGAGVVTGGAGLRSFLFMILVGVALYVFLLFRFNYIARDGKGFKVNI